MSSDRKLLFAGLWPLVSVLIALHMDVLQSKKINFNRYINNIVNKKRNTESRVGLAYRL